MRIHLSVEGVPNVKRELSVFFPSHYFPFVIESLEALRRRTISQSFSFLTTRPKSDNDSQRHRYIYFEKEKERERVRERERESETE